METTAYLVRRLTAAAITIVLVIGAVFVIFFVIPGGPGRRQGAGAVSPAAQLIAGKRIVDREYVRQLERELGLSIPLHEQFLRYLGNVAQGDFGYEYRRGLPVAPIMRSSAPVTLSLIVGASIIWLTVAIGGGAWAARRHRSSGERRATLLASGLMSLPVFVTGLLVLALLAPRDVYRFNSYVPFTEDPIGHARAMWLPWLVLASSFAGIYYRLTRGSMLEVANEDYVRTAEAKGLSDLGVTRHQLRAALTPIASVYSVDVAVLVGSAVLIETVFQLPGMGAMLSGALTDLNYPIIAGLTVIGSAFVIAVSLLVDLAYARIDPRVGSKATPR